MNIMYLHGFASAFDIENDKVRYLLQKGRLTPVHYNSCADYTTNIDTLINKVIDNDIDLLIGCSLGGFYALEIASVLKKVFAVALNPAYKPHLGLQKYVGKNTNFKTGDIETLTSKVVASYPQNGVACPKNGLVLIEKGDEVINWDESRAYFSKHDTTQFGTFNGGNHRFSSLPQRWSLIETLYNEYKRQL
jgi:predicted esterase YcpF (UPF0227 family)